MSTKNKNTNKPYKIIVHKNTPNVDLYILDQLNDEIITVPFNQEKTTAENLIQAISYVTIEMSVKLTEVAIKPAD